MSKICDECLKCHWYSDDVLEECQGQGEHCHEFSIGIEYKNWKLKGEANGWLKEIKSEPTAFDKKNVIKELQRHSHNYYPSIDHYCVSQKVVKLKDAIEIVEKGGIE